MKNPITTLHIQNFKTIKDLEVKPKRINIIIGKPNVGKSNFLEALSLLGAGYSPIGSKFMSEFIRYNKLEDLFYDKVTSDPIIVETNLGLAYIKHLPFENFAFVLAPSIKELDKVNIENDFLQKIRNDFASKEEKFDSNGHQFPFFIHPYINQKGDIGDKNNYVRWFSPVKSYKFKDGIAYNSDRRAMFLFPPHGQNLYTIIDSSKHKRDGVLKEIADFFKEYKLQFAIRQSDTTFEVQKKVKSVVYPFAYELIADTLQRMIFNIAAIESNKESILLFEEPEAHSFPPYIKLFAEKIIKSKSNQFFITTHSPFILNTIIENTPLEQVSVFIATYDKFQTKMKELTKSELEEMLNYGNDIFFSPKLRSE
jgi:AAA15 family ATPase/GTPase